MKFGIGPVLFLVFMVLKLTNHIAWSWWWVSSPLWIPLVLWAVFALVVVSVKVWADNR